MRTDEINSDQDVIDSRDVIARIEELTDLRDTAQKLTDDQPDREYMTEFPNSRVYLDSDFGHSEYHELQQLLDLQSECENLNNEWVDGCTLIRETHFTEYCQELVADIGDLPKDLPAYIVIDWEATAENLRADYSSVEFAGVTYLLR